MQYINTHLEIFNHKPTVLSFPVFPVSIQIICIYFDIYILLADGWTLNSKLHPVVCCAAKDDRHRLVWRRAGPPGGVHPAGGEGPAAELSPTLQGPRLQQARHGE